jgi:glyceraldehyde 3-phosphate dehydrogenase
MIKVAINGFGRIGRMVFRIMLDRSDIECVAINDLTSVDNIAYLLKYDSVHGRFDKDISYEGNDLIVEGKKIPIFAQRDPEQLPWKDLDVDVVIESTGFFRTHEKANKHIIAGAKKVIISAPASDPDITLVRGVNEHLYDFNKHHIISNASCTTNCLAPIVKVLEDNFKIRKGFMTTVHAYTNDQTTLDLPKAKDFRRGRAAAQNIVPTSTGAAKAVSLVIPSIKGKLDGIAIRVPVACGSVTDLVCGLERDTSVEEINNLFENVSNHHLKGILEFSKEPLVSSDIVNNPHSSIFDSALTSVNGRMIKVVSWYDNEFGYSNRMVDMITHVMKK